jgi:macrolide-specific efflux system membrane fusion protein
MNRPGKAALVLILAVAIAGALLFLRKPRAVRVRTYAARRGPIEETIRAPRPGRILTHLKMELSFALSGRIAEVHAVPGQLVSRDQVLLSMDPDEQEARVAKASADLARDEADLHLCEEKERLAQTELERIQALVLSGAAPESGLAAARSRLRSAAASTELARRNVQLGSLQVSLEKQGLAGLHLRAPEDGVVKEVTAEKGEKVLNRQTVAIIENSGSTLRVELDEPTFLRVLRAQSVLSRPHLDARVTAHGRTVPGRLRTVRPLMTDRPQDRTVDVDLHGVTSEDGLEAEAEFVVREEPEAIKIPAEALRDGPSVFVVAGRYASRRPVRAGAMDGSFAEILQGLSEGEAVIVSSEGILKEGGLVEVTAADVPDKLPEEGVPLIRLEADPATPVALTVTASASQRFGTVEVPWPFARIEVGLKSGPGPRTYAADAEGRLTFKAIDLWRAVGSPGEALIVATVRGRNGPASGDWEYTADLQARDRKQVEARADELFRAAARHEADGKWAEARSAYRGILSELPGNAPAWGGLGRALEQMGLAFDAILAFRQALVLDTAVDSRLDDIGKDERIKRQRPLRERAVRLSRTLTEKPPPSPVARELLSAAYDAAHAGDYLKAYYLAMEAQNAAPWWREAYLEAAFLFYAFWLERKGAYTWDAWDFERTLELTENPEGADKLRQWMDNARAQDGKYADVRDRARTLGEEFQRLQKEAGK